MRIFEILLDLIFPPHCAFCGTLLTMGKQEKICEECRQKVVFCSQQHCCEKCGKPVLGAYNSCRHCRTYAVQNFDQICSVCVYDGPAKDGIVAYKGNSLVESGAAFADMLADRIKYTYVNIVFDAVIAVPPRRNRIREKHFDQAAFLAERTARVLRLPYLRRLLYQKENRKKQSGLGYLERYENVNENFAVRDAKQISGKTILVVDDVCTSRATLNECARALKIAGAKAVYCATVATTA